MNRIRPESDKPTLIMVNGAARSGTTMLDLMLGSADNAFSCGELHAKFWPFRRHHFNPICGCGDPQCPVWKPLLDVPQQHIHSALLEPTKASVIVDSSKDLRWVLKSNSWADDQGMRVVNILLWKSPRELAYSYWKRGKSIGFFRRSFLTYHERFLSLQLPFVAVHYHDLATRTSETLQTLCNVVGIQYQDKMEEFWRKKHHQMFGSAGTGEQIGRSGGGIYAQTEYPDDFLQDFESYCSKTEPDHRLNRVVELLQNQDVFGITKPGLPSISSRPYSRRLWYPWHTIKRTFHGKFPKGAPVK